MGIKITTDDKGVKVYRSDKFERPHYAIQISKKEGEEWINHYQEIRFRKGEDVPDRAIIHIRNAFPTVSSWVKDNSQHVKEVWQIMDYYIEGSVPVMADEPADSFSVAEDQIPF